MEKRVLVSRWLGSDTPSIPIYDEASVSSARQRVREAGKAAHLTEILIESVALIASELTHNQLAHAKQGYFSVRPITREGVAGLEVIAADLGPGLAKVFDAAVQKSGGTSSMGAGLEGVFRVADEVEIDTRREEGVCVVARKFESATVRACEFAIAGEPYPGEGISGDDAVCFNSETGFLAAVCDGLGHGPEAREASSKAVESITRHRDLDVAGIVMAVNRDIKGTRGCAMAVARFNQGTRLLQCVSAGDIRPHLYHLRDAHFFTTTPTVVGDRDLPLRRLRVEDVTVEPGSVFAMFTDGLVTKATLKGDLDVLRLPAVAIGQRLIETYSRGTDDSLALVARFRK